MLHKLKAAGITGKLLRWFEAYMSDRKQRVVVNGVESPLRNIDAGVPQGSILGPLLFILYMNDLVSSLDLEIKLYADDATLYVQYKDCSTKLFVSLQTFSQLITVFS